MSEVKDEAVKVAIYRGMNGYAVSSEYEPALLLSKDYFSIHYFDKGRNRQSEKDTVWVLQKTPEKTLVVTVVFDVEDYDGNAFESMSDFHDKLYRGYRGMVYKHLMAVEIADMKVDSEYTDVRQGCDSISQFFYSNVYGLMCGMLRLTCDASGHSLEGIKKASEYGYLENYENCRVLSAQAYADRFEVDEYADNPMSCFCKIEGVTED